MQVDLIDTIDGFEALKENWELVHDLDPEADYFLSWRWFAQVLRANPGCWRILAARSGSDQSRYSAFLPLRLKARWSQSRREFCTELEAAGRLSWGQYTGFVCRPECERETIAGLAARLRQTPWSTVTINNCAASDHRLEAFLSEFAPSDYEISYGQAIINNGTVDNLVCPFVQLPGDFETYLQTCVSANTRQKIRRFSRRIEQSQDQRITLTEPAHFERDFNVLLALWRRMWAPVRGEATAEKTMRKYREILAQSLACDAVILPVFRQGEVILGALANIVDRHKQRMYFIVAGRDEAASDPFIGLLLHAWCIRWAIENKISVYDLCHGNEPYKYSLGATDRRIKNLTIRRRSRVEIGRLDPSNVADALDQTIEFLEGNRVDDAIAACRQLRTLSSGFLPRIVVRSQRTRVSTHDIPGLLSP